MTSTPDAAWRDVLAALPDPAVVSVQELSGLVGVLGRMQAALDAVKVRTAGQVVRRWDRLDAVPDGPALRDGHRSPAGMLADRWQTSYPTGKQFCDIADAVTPRVDETGDLQPASFPVLAGSLDPVDAGVGRVSVDQAAVIVRELGKAAAGCDPEAIGVGERLLVRHAPNLTVTETRTLAGQIRDRLDLHGILPREQVQTGRRSLTIGTTSDGMTHINWYLHPEAAGTVITAITALVGAQMRAVRFRDTAVEPGEEEYRSLAQMRSDAATDIFRHHTTGTSPGGSLPAATMIVRISLDALTTGLGYGDIDGIPTPISAATARRLAADANIIPIVLNGNSEILDLGRAQRLFTPQQKLALAERDGGCAWPGCPHPPTYTEAHHLHWWNTHHGPTNLDNGILLCSHHHHRIHNHGWQIHIRDNIPWFTPPHHIDPHQRPRQGGRIQTPNTGHPT
jgi:hypothetical protein